jgi:hypothetical protein
MDSGQVMVEWDAKVLYEYTVLGEAGFGKECLFGVCKTPSSDKKMK